MGPREKLLLHRWLNDAASWQQQVNDDTDHHKPQVSPERKVCRHCNQVFNSGRALGGHIKVHYANKFTRKKRRRRRDYSLYAPQTRSSSRGNKCGSEIIDLSKFLSGWKVHKKRGSKKRRDSSDEDGRDCFGMRRSLREFGFSYLYIHEISMIRTRYACLTCNLVFPTFHAARCHIYGGDSSQEGAVVGAKSSAKKLGRVAEAHGKSGSVNDQEMSDSKAPKVLGFDLNDVPPKEDEA